MKMIPIKSPNNGRDSVSTVYVSSPNRLPVVGLACSQLLRCWPMSFHENPQTTQTVSKTMDALYKWTVCPY